LSNPSLIYKHERDSEVAFALQTAKIRQLNCRSYLEKPGVIFQVQISTNSYLWSAHTDRQSAIHRLHEAWLLLEKWFRLSPSKFWGLF